MADLKKKEIGVSLQEVLIVVAIMVVLATLFLGGYMTQLKKGRDGKRKADLDKISLAFEDYFNDAGCYPADVSMFGDENKCGSKEAYPGGFAPYLVSVPCDSLGSPYKVRAESSPCPSWYAVYTTMEYQADFQVQSNECFSGCYIDGEKYNYGIASGQVSPLTVSDAPPAEPTVSTTPSCGSNCYIKIIDPIRGDKCNSSGGCVEIEGEQYCYHGRVDCSGWECCQEACKVSSCP